MEDSIRLKLRPQVLLSQADVARRIRTALGLLKVEAKMLRARLAADPADPHDPARAKFAAGWKAIEERLATERQQCPSLKEGNTAEWTDEGLRFLIEEVRGVRTALVADPPVDAAAIGERLDGIETRNRELSLALDQFCRAVGEEVDRLVAAYRNEP